MDQIRQHHLYPKLVALVSKFKTDDPKHKIEKIARDIPQDELTITRLLYHACSWCVGTIKYKHAEKLYKKLSKAKLAKITSDGYLATYQVTYNQCWPGIVEDLARFGITAMLDDNQVHLSYTALPDINITVKWEWDNKPFRGLFAYETKINLNLNPLQAKLVGKYGTPYPEEVIALRFIALLPQPIAEAIADCIHGVIERRFVEYPAPALSYTSQHAFERELYYTAQPYDIYIPNGLHMQDKRDWEAIVAPFIEKKLADDAAYKLRRANHQATHRDSSDDDFGPTCGYGHNDDDGW